MDDPKLNEQIRAIVNEELSRRQHLGIKERTALKTPDTFGNWLANLTTKAKGLYSTIIAIPSLATVFGLVLKVLPSNQPTWNRLKIEWILMGLVFLQAIVILLLYRYIPPPPELTKEVMEKIERNFRAKAKKRKSDFDQVRFQDAYEVSKDFSKMWRWAWLLWAALYFAWGFIILSALTSQGQLFTNGDIIGVLDRWFPLTSFLNNLSIIFLFICYGDLDFPTRVRQEKQRNLQIYLSALIVLVAVVDAFLVINHLASPIHILLGWVGSFAAGAVIALLVGRLESKVINPPALMTASLYLYAAIQGSFFLFPKDPPLMLTLTSLAFLFKIGFFLLMAWLLDSGILTFYLAQLQLIYETIPERKSGFIMAIHNLEEKERQKP